MVNGAGNFEEQRGKKDERLMGVNQPGHVLGFLWLFPRCCTRLNDTFSLLFCCYIFQRCRCILILFLLASLLQKTQMMLFKDIICLKHLPFQSQKFRQKNKLSLPLQKWMEISEAQKIQTEEQLSHDCHQRIKNRRVIEILAL